MYAFRVAILLATALAALLASNAEGSVFGPVAERALDSILQQAGHGRRSPLEHSLLRDAADGALQQHSLAEAALIASGVQDPVRLQYYIARLNELCGELRGSDLLQGSESQQLQAIFESMHAGLLTGQYDARSSSLAVLLEQGRYNCVSSTILFHALAEHFRLRVTAVQSPTHLFSVANVNGRELPIETTCPNWFDAISKNPGPHSLRESCAAGQPLRRLTPIELVAVVYYNHGVDRLAAGDHASAVDSTQIALQLDPSNAAARGNLLAALNNWALACSKQGNHPRAAAILNAGMLAEPAHRIFEVNQAYVHQTWADVLCSEGAFREAVQVLEQSARHWPSRAAYDARLIAIYRLWAKSLFDRGQKKDALAVLDELRSRYPGRTEPVVTGAAAINDAASRLINTRHYEESYQRDRLWPSAAA